ncbi:unnamed protein product, partial [Phaeothamnion confervicola]
MRRVGYVVGWSRLEEEQMLIRVVCKAWGWVRARAGRRNKRNNEDS